MNTNSEKLRKWILLVASIILFWNVGIFALNFLGALTYNTPEKKAILINSYKYDLQRLNLSEDQIYVAVAYASVNLLIFATLYLIFIFKFKKDSVKARKFGLILSGVNTVLLVMSITQSGITGFLEIALYILLFILLLKFK